MSSVISGEVRARVAAHLDAVEKQLNAAGVLREKRRGIVDDLETHITELLDAAGDRPITLAEIDELLRHLDPPEAYGKDNFQQAPATTTVALENIGEPKLCSQARQGIGWIALAMLAQVVLVLGSMPYRVVTPPGGVVDPGPSPGILIFMGILILAAVISPIIGTALGWIALERIRNSEGKLYGFALAAVETVFYPLIAVGIGAFVLWYWIVIAYYNGPEVPNRGRAVWLIGSTCTAVFLSVILGLILRRLSRPSASAGQKMAA